MDVLVPKVGEIIGGSQREERLEVLKDRGNFKNPGRVWRDQTCDVADHDWVRTYALQLT